MKKRLKKKLLKSTPKLRWNLQPMQEQQERIDDGFSTTITFTRNPNVKLWEKEVTPPGVGAGGPTDTTTMRNRKWRTLSPKKLRSLTAASFNAAYDTAVYVQLLEMVGVNQPIEIRFADGSRLQFWGWLDDFKPSGITEGNQPIAACSLQPSNQDDTNTEVEPIYIDSEGDTNDTNNPPLSQRPDPI